MTAQFSYIGNPVADLTIYDIFGVGSLPAAAMYRLLADHYLAEGVTYAGTIITEGVDVPSPWIPTVDVEPLNSSAAQKYFNAGPRASTGLIRTQLTAQFVSQPVTFWKQIAPGQWALTGLGAGLGSVFSPQVGRE